MAAEFTITGDGELMESETIVNEVTFSAAQIDDKIKAIGNHIDSLQAELAIWAGRKTTLAGLQAK